MDSSVENFYLKNSGSEYIDSYASQHRARHEFMFERFSLGEIKDKKVAEFGCGLGITFSMLDGSNEMVGFDGATILEEKKLADFESVEVNLDEDHTRKEPGYYMSGPDKFDVSFCLETLEHVASPFRALNNLKHFTKIGGDVYISIPAVRMTHPVIYHQLFYPHTNFADFLECMALPPKESALYDGDWPSWIFKCKNRPWREKKMHFYKGEEKFRDANLLEVTNL